MPRHAVGLPSTDTIALLVPSLHDAFAALKRAQAAPAAGPERDRARAVLQEKMAAVAPQAASISESLVEALLALPSSEIDELEVSLESAVRELGGDAGAQNAEKTAKAATSVGLAAHKTFLALPLKARRALVNVLPEQMRPIGVALQFVSLDQARSLAMRLPALQEAAQVVAQDREHGGQQQQEQQQEDAAAAHAARVKAAKLLRDTYMDLPDRSRRAMFQALPKEARPVAEMAEGVKSEKDFDTLLRFVDGGDEQQTGASKTEGGGEDQAEAAAKKQAKAAASLAARAEARRLWTWIRGDCCSAKVLNFLAGLSLVVAGVVGILIETFNKFRVFQIGICFYVALFGSVFAILEAKSQLCSTYAVARIEKYVGCLHTSVGRAVTLVFSGLMCFSVFDPSTSGWTEILLLAAGGFACVLGVINCLVGCCAQQRLNEARGKLASEAQLREAFDTYDLEMRGVLAPEDVVAMLASLDPPTVLSRNEMHAALLQLDKNRDGGVSWDELSRWWSGAGSSTGVANFAVANPVSGIEDSAEATLNQPLTQGPGNANSSSSAGDPSNELQKKWTVSTVGPWSIRAWNIFVLGAFTLSAFAMVFVELFYRSSNDPTGKGVWVLMAILQAVLAVLGAVCTLLEARLTVRGKNVTLLVAENARFLNRVWGRGIFYLFISTLALGIGTMIGQAADTSTLVTGGLLMATALLNIVVGGMATRALGGLGSLSVADARREFKEADKDGNGYLDMTELHAVMEKFGITLGRAQFEAACVEIDADGDGRITEREFVAWTQRKDVIDMVEANVSGEGGLV